MIKLQQFEKIDTYFYKENGKYKIFQQLPPQKLLENNKYKFYSDEIRKVLESHKLKVGHYY